MIENRITFLAMSLVIFFAFESL